MELLRFATAGSVDDGKSTLIGRLLYDSQGDLRGPARGGRAHQPRARRRVHQPRAAHRRPARRARAGHHDRRRLPLLRDAQAQVHHRRHPGPRPVHPQHGHRRLDRRPRAHPGRRAQRAWSSRPAGTRSSPRCCGCRTSCCASTRWTSSTTTEDVFEEIRDEFTRVRDQARRPRPHVHPDLGAATATTSSTRSDEHALVRRAVAAAPPRGRAHRLRPQPDRRPVPGAVRDPAAVRRRTTTTAATPGQVAGGVLKPGDEVVVLPSRLHVDDRGDRHRRRAGRRGVPADVGDRPARPTTSTSRRGDMICRPHNQPQVTQDIDAMVCWMDATSRCARARSSRSSTRPAAARALVKDLQYRLDVNTLHRDEDAERARPQRDRPGPAAHDAAAVRRRVPPQPHHRRVHPHRRGDEPDRRRRDDHLRRLAEDAAGRDDRAGGPMAGRGRGSHGLCRRSCVRRARRPRPGRARGLRPARLARVPDRAPTARRRRRAARSRCAVPAEQAEARRGRGPRRARGRRGRAGGRARRRGPWRGPGRGDGDGRWLAGGRSRRCGR